MNPKKTAIVTSGGGMKCAYSAGALVALAKKIGFHTPDIFVSASGSVAGMFYYLAHQYDDIEKIWTRYASARGLISYSPLPKMDIDYLIDTIFKDFVPLDTEALKKSPTHFLVPVTDFDSGEPRYLSDMHLLDPYEIMRAAKAIPILYNGHVHLGNHSYIDGNFSTSNADLIKKALEEGARRILLITNTETPGVLGRTVLRAYGMFLNPHLREHIVDDLISHEKIEWPDDIEFVCVSPTFTLPTFIFSRDKRKITETYFAGHDDLLAKKNEIAKLFCMQSELPVEKSE